MEHSANYRENTATRNFSAVDMDSVDQSASNVNSELFRAKIYQHFLLLEASGAAGLEGGLTENAIASPSEFDDPESIKRLKRERPFAIVQSDPYPEDKQELLFQTYGDVRVRSRRKLRARISRIPPLEVFARWLVENESFQFFILLVIGYNSITLGLQAEYGDRTGPSAATARIVLDCLDILALTIFIFEIWLKFMVNFEDFWDNSWNIFDLLITAFTFVTTVIQLIGSTNEENAELRSVASTMKAFQVLRLLRILTRSQGMKVIIYTVTQSLKDMGSILILFCLFLYIFLVTGVIFMQDMRQTAKYLTPQNSTEEMKRYAYRFQNLYWGFLTLYQIFTVDHWYAMLHESWIPIMKDAVFPVIYTLLWLLIGSLIFRNIFAGVVVNTFQSLREKVEEEEEDDDQGVDDKNFNEFKDFIDKQIAQEAVKMTSEENLLLSAFDSTASLANEGLQDRDYLKKINRDSAEWLCSLTKSIQMMDKLVGLKPTKWTHELMFSYFQVMEKLQDNLYERQEIIKLMDEWVIAIMNRDDPTAQPTASDRAQQLKQMLKNRSVAASGPRPQATVTVTM